MVRRLVFGLTLLAACGGGTSVPVSAPDGGAPNADGSDSVGLPADAGSEALPTGPGADAAPPAPGDAEASVVGGQPPDAGPASGACLMNSECPAPLLCAGGRCRSVCVETRDCPSGRCVNNPTGRFCLPQTESRCTSAGECPSVLVCAVDGQCRNECRAHLDCPPGQACADQVCAEPTEVNDGHLKGWPGDGGLPDAPMLWGLSPGARRFRVTAVDVKVDGCKLEPALLQGLTLPVTYDDATWTLSIGNPQGSPVMPALGSGKVSANMATLVRDNLDIAGACSYHRRDLSRVILFDHDKFTLDVTEDQSMFGSACTPVPMGGKCTSSWRWRMEIAP
jgi:hypothetical protein